MLLLFSFPDMRAIKRWHPRIAALAPGLGLAVACFFAYPVAAAQSRFQDPAHPAFTQEVSQKSGMKEAPALPARKAKQADFLNERPSPDSRYIADWVVDSGNNQGMPFIIINKVHAMAFLFDAQGRLRGAAPVLIGAAVGDDSAPGIGTRKLADIRPDERTTPAGRFVASLAKNFGKEILWVDYKADIALHAVVTSNPKERRPQRLASGTPLDKRISFGCINVPATFFENVVKPAFTGTNGIVYVLPETRPVHKAFGSYAVQARGG